MAARVCKVQSASCGGSSSASAQGNDLCVSTDRGSNPKRVNDLASHGCISTPSYPATSPAKCSYFWWLLESGTGTFGTINPEQGTYQPIVELPGFTRGLSFCGPLAFIGLSQVRETVFFGGIPIAEKALDERACGVWVVNIDTSEVIGFVKFEDAVQEIFAVEILPNSRNPDLINDDKKIIGNSYELPDNTLADVPDELK